MPAIGYIHFLVVLLMLTGIFIWYFDGKAYQKGRMQREKKAAKLLGALNVSLGILLFVANWVVENLFW